MTRPRFTNLEHFLYCGCCSQLGYPLMIEWHFITCQLLQNVSLKVEFCSVLLNQAVAGCCHWPFTTNKETVVACSLNFYLFLSFPLKVLGIMMMFVGRFQSLCVLFWSAVVFTLEPLLPTMFGVVESHTLTLTEASEACSVLDVFLGCFVTCCIGGQCALWVILVGQPFFRWFTTVPSFLPVCKMALSHPESYKWLCKPFQTEMCQCLCFSFILEIHEFVAWCAHESF